MDHPSDPGFAAHFRSASKSLPAVLTLNPEGVVLVYFAL